MFELNRVNLVASLLVGLIAVSPLVGVSASEQRAQPSAEQLRHWYSKPQSEWPSPILAPGVDHKPLAAISKEPPFKVSGSKLEARLELGELLFFDPLLSGSKQHACASCHDPDLGWADGRRFSFGHDRQRGNLNAPTIDRKSVV